MQRQRWAPVPGRGPDTRWTSAAEATQLYIRPELKEPWAHPGRDIGPRNGSVTPNDPVSAQHNGQSVEYGEHLSASTVEPSR